MGWEYLGIAATGTCLTSCGNGYLRLFVHELPSNFGRGGEEYIGLWYDRVWFVIVKDWFFQVLAPWGTG